MGVDKYSIIESLELKVSGFGEILGFGGFFGSSLQCHVEKSVPAQGEKHFKQYHCARRNTESRACESRQSSQALVGEQQRICLKNRQPKLKPASDGSLGSTLSEASHAGTRLLLSTRGNDWPLAPRLSVDYSTKICCVQFV